MMWENRFVVMYDHDRDERGVTSSICGMFNKPDDVLQAVKDLMSNVSDLDTVYIGIADGTEEQMINTIRRIRRSSGEATE